MTTNKHRILIWPSDQGNIPKLPIYPDDSSGPDSVDQIRLGTAVVGWVDETACVTTIIAAGSVLLSPNSEGVEKSKTEVECSTITISSAINILAERYPCKYSTKSDGCGICYDCSTCRSLRVLGIVESGEPETDKEDARENESIQLILYNQTEAETYLQDQHHKRGESYPNGTWQRNALRMGEALSVFEELSLTMKSTQHCQPEERSSMNEVKDDSADFCDTETPSSFEQQKNATHQTILHLSLFLLRLKSGTCSHQKAKKGRTIFSHMPFVSIFQGLIHAKTTISSKSHRLGWRERQKRMDFQSIALVLDFFLGLIIGCILLTYPFVIVQSIIQLWKNFHNQQWNDGLEWLESFPAGFKLNVALTQKIGKEARLALQLHEHIASYLFKNESCVDIIDANTHTYNNFTFTVAPTTFVKCLGISTILFGSQFFFGFAFDLTQVALLHIRFLSSVFAACQRLELSTLVSLWGLFCGKKRNVLRLRYDTLKYDHMQLLLGTILFTICLFMFTTILVYHCFFATMNYLAELFLCGCWWFGFMAVEGIARCDFIVTSTRRRQNYAEKTWIGREMQFLPVRISDTSHVDCLLENIGSILGGNTKALIFRKQQFKSGQGQECTKHLFPHVSISSKRLSVMKVKFPSNSDSSIIATACCSFVMSKTTQIVSFLRCLVFGTPCLISSALVDLATNPATRPPV